MCYTASLMDWKLKSRVLIGGTTMAAPMSPDSDALTRIARPIASRLFSMIGAAILSSRQEGGNPVLGFLVTEVSLKSRI